MSLIIRHLQEAATAEHVMLVCFFGVLVCAVNRPLLNSSSVRVANDTFGSNISTNLVPGHQVSVDVASGKTSKSGRDFTTRLSMPVIRGGLNSNISDILEASGYGTETDIQVDDEYRFMIIFRF